MAGLNTDVSLSSIALSVFHKSLTGLLDDINMAGLKADVSISSIALSVFYKSLT